MSKNYVGNGWQHPKFEDCINISLKLEELNKLETNQYGDIKLTVAKMKQPNEKTKATHTVYVNDYKPSGEQSRQPYPTAEDIKGDLPF